MFRRRNKQYRTVKRIPRYKYRLVERSFCLDVNFLSSSGFFKWGRGPIWDYSCRNEKLGYLGGFYLQLVDSEHGDAFGIRIDNPTLLQDIVTVTNKYLSHPLVRWRDFLICPKCKRRAAKLYLPQGIFELACRKCHRLVYLSQMRGIRRLGREKYYCQKKAHEVKKLLTIKNSDS